MDDKLYNTECLKKMYITASNELKSRIMNRINILNNFKNSNAIFSGKYKKEKGDEDLLEKIDSTGTIACIIMVRNEERCISRCINSVIDVFDEIIIIDTGSIDKTIAIIKSYNTEKIKLYHHDWVNNFATIRNYGVNQTTCNWIFHIDADEYFVDMSYDKLHNIVCSLTRYTYRNNVVIAPEIIDDSINFHHHDVPRIYYNSNNIYYYGKVHEELRIKSGQFVYLKSNITLNHDGYNFEIMKNKNKQNRNLRLLESMIDKEPNYNRWKYFYIRDGEGKLNATQIKELAYSCILKDKAKGLTIENLNVDQYTFPILNCLCKISVERCDIAEVSILCDLMEKLIPNNSNSIYYRTLIEFLEIKSKVQELFNRLVMYRKNNFSRQENMITTEGYHIDLLLGIFLFEQYDFKRAYKYFEFLEDKFNTLEMKRLIHTFLEIRTS